VSDTQAALKHAYALGVDRAIHVKTAEQLQPLSIAKVIEAITRQESPGLLLLGKQTIDGDHNQTVRGVSNVCYAGPICVSPTLLDINVKLACVW
jgi:electron transfer flavoprotein beta subunit